MSYKISKYTYLIKLTDEQFILFNGYSRQFLIIPSHELNNYLNIIKRCNEVSNRQNERIASRICQLIEANILVDTSVEECKLVVNNICSYADKDEFHTMILPTYDCNYNCWYCVQRHHKTEMAPEVVKLVEKHILQYLRTNKMPRYVLYWFGGEPLMQKGIIQTMTSTVSAYCAEHGIEFVCQITTNGALLDIPTIKMLKSLHIDNYQITLDGDKKMHDKTKFDAVHASSFDLICDNLANLLMYNENANVVLRYNYTPQNIKKLSVVDDLLVHIPQGVRNRIRVDLQRVWQVREKNLSLGDLDLLQKKFVANGLGLLTSGMFEPCYVEKHRFEVIYYNGKVDVCDNFAFDKARGKIMEDGSLNWNQAVEKPDFHSECLDCSFFPVCLEECPAKRLRKKEDGTVFSCTEQIKKHVEYTIKDYCLRTINNQKLK